MCALVYPVATLTALRLLFGAYALADGLIIMSQFAHPKLDHGRGLRLRGLASIALGMFISLWSSVTAPALVAIIATWTILARVFKAVALNGVVSKRTVSLGQPIRAQDDPRALKKCGDGLHAGVLLCPAHRQLPMRVVYLNDPGGKAMDSKILTRKLGGTRDKWLRQERVLSQTQESFDGVNQLPVMAGDQLQGVLGRDDVISLLRTTTELHRR